MELLYERGQLQREPREKISVIQPAESHAPHLPRALLLVALLVTLLGFMIRSIGGPAATDWTIDNGGKALALEQLQDSPRRTWISYAGAGVDPEFHYFPQPLAGEEPYGFVRGGRVISQYLAPFVFLALPFAMAFGAPGVAALPALGGGFAAWATGLLARSAGASPLLAALVLATASPLVFYSSVFWEHTILVALVTGALVALAARPAAAGLLLGAAVLLREESGLVLVAAGMALALDPARRRGLLRLAGGAGIGLAAAVAFHLAVSGTPFGVHLGVNRPVPLLHTLRAIDGLVTNPGASGLPAWCGALAVAAALLARNTPRFVRFEPVALAAMAAISLASFVRFPAGEDRALALIHSNSLLVAAPWAAPFLLDGFRRAAPLPARAATIALLLLLALVPARSITGIHPGPRLLLPLLPVFAIAFAGAVRGASRVRAAFLITLAALGALDAGRALVLLHEKRGAMDRISSAIAEDPRRVVVTDLFWLPTELHALWNHKTFHLVGGPEDLRELASRYAARGESALLVVTSPGSVRGAPPVRVVTNPGFPHFSAELHVQSLAR